MEKQQIKHSADTVKQNKWSGKNDPPGLKMYRNVKDIY